MERSLYWYKGSQLILTNMYVTAFITKQVARELVFPPCLIQHKLLSLKYDLKEKKLE